MSLQPTSSPTMRSRAGPCIATVLAVGVILGPLGAHAEPPAVSSYAVAMAIEANGEQSAPRVLAKAGEQFAVASGEWRFEMTVRQADTPDDVWLAGKIFKGYTIISAPTLLAHLNDKATVKVGDGANPFTLSMIVSPIKAEPTKSNGSMTYNIALQNEYGVEKQTVTVPAGEIRELRMVGGVVQISSPGSSNDGSVVKFSSGSGTKPVLTHTANIRNSSEKPLEIAYTICGQSLQFQSPAPEKLKKCPTVASIGER